MPTTLKSPKAIPALSSSVRRWLVWFLLASIFAIACWFLSQWQLTRLNEVKTVISRINANYDSVPIALGDLVNGVERFEIKDEYRPVSVTGEYQSELLTLVRNRPNNGQPGFEMLVPFKLSNSKIVFVDRGWLPTGSKQDLPDQVVAPITKTINLVGRLKQSAEDSMKTYPESEFTQIGAASIAEAARVLKLTRGSYYEGFYLVLASESTLDAKPLPLDANLKRLSRPQITEGNHLSYAFQWILFALMAFFAIGWAIRQELLHRKAALDPTFVIKKRKSLGAEDAAIEDAVSEAPQTNQ